ncbi:NucA/NucB deoxyribonuclease domain-containing protein, partial [Nocardiopsis valliformis]|uniref:NucA/NucB deoxyribonuclease domain-containing protein n=1 Tax=Nocardiopsis valliformis TaxID=239974 RepID=UPI0019552ACD
QTSSGTWVQISAVEVVVRSAAVHKLTVQGMHTYHVMARDLDLLNHNCNRVFSVNSSGYATALPVHEIDFVAYPGGVQNFTNAIANGHSPIVARLTGRSAIRANRNAAQRGQPRPGALAQGLSWEEFPFASTYEVGAGATLRLISRRENVAQGRDSL